MTLVDVHQHLWTDALLDRLAERDRLPFVRRQDGLTILHSAAEQPYVIDVTAEAPDRRGELVHADGLDLAVLALSSPIGIEALPRQSALELIEAFFEGTAGLPEGFSSWGPVALDGAEPDEVDDALARGCVGISLPAGALAGPDRVWAVGPVLERAAARGVPVFVHPGRAPGERFAEAAFGEPLWWRALTDYVNQMQAAWLGFVAFARRDHPELTAVFAMMAGGAPLLSERLAVRGGPAVELHDPRIFYDTSSYGPGAIDAMAARVGAVQLVYGSDRPVVEPVRTPADRALQENGERLLFGRVGAAA